MFLTVLGRHGPYPRPGGACSGYFIEDGSTRVLIDCGSGVLSRLMEHVHPAHLDAIVLSHLHFDHAGGLLAPWVEGHAAQLLFPNAIFVVGKAHWQRALHPHPRDRASFIPELPALLQASGRLELVDGDYSQALGQAVRFHHSDGHTPGLMLPEVVGPHRVDEQPHGGVVFCADLIPGRPWVHVPITMGYDRCAETLIDEKRAFLQDMLARNVQLFFTHDAGCAMAQVVCDDKGRFAATQEQAELVAWELG